MVACIKKKHFIETTKHAWLFSASPQQTKTASMTISSRKRNGFIRGIQWDEKEGADKSNPAHGGAGYGKHKRPDLSNTNFLVEALKASGAGPDDPAMKKALAFVSRCQKLGNRTQYNKTCHKKPRWRLLLHTSGRRL